VCLLREPHCLTMHGWINGITSHVHYICSGRRNWVWLCHGNNCGCQSTSVCTFLQFHSSDKESNLFLVEMMLQPCFKGLKLLTNTRMLHFLIYWWHRQVCWDDVGSNRVEESTVKNVVSWHSLFQVPSFLADLLLYVSVNIDFSLCYCVIFTWWILQVLRASHLVFAWCFSN